MVTWTKVCDSGDVRKVGLSNHFQMRENAHADGLVVRLEENKCFRSSEWINVINGSH